MSTTGQEAQVIYWHGQLPPLDAEPNGEQVVEADSIRVKAIWQVVVRCGIAAMMI
jgi:hypothetical protein